MICPRCHDAEVYDSVHYSLDDKILVTKCWKCGWSYFHGHHCTEQDVAEASGRGNPVLEKDKWKFSRGKWLTKAKKKRTYQPRLFVTNPLPVIRKQAIAMSLEPF